MKNNERDDIDFGKMNISRLFVKLFVPTLMGMIFSAIFNIADGIIVGHGVGSDALAAVNIAAPIFLISSSTALMFATGVSIVAAIHLSRGNNKAANINITQALTVPLVVISFLCLASLFFARPLCFLFGGSEGLCYYVVDYLHWLFPCPLFIVVYIVGSFVIRLDGSPKYAMYATVFPSILNIFLDWLFVFPLNMGIMGAAFATSISIGIGAFMIIVYMLWYSKTLKLYKPKITHTSIRLTYRNIGYITKLGFPTFIGEGAISCMMIAGNYMFMNRLHEDGVAAFSVCCYLFPLAFMFGNSIAGSQLPIVSYNYGLNDHARILKIFNLSVVLAIFCGIFMMLLGIFGRDMLISLFLIPETNAYNIAIKGFPYFAISFLFFPINLAVIGFWQSIERVKASNIFMLLRGIVVVVCLFLLLPNIIGNIGLWLAVPISEAFTFIIIAICTIVKRKSIL